MDVLSICAASLGRLLLSFTPLYDVLKHDHLLSSPLTSYTRLQEGVFLQKHGIDPYSGGGFYHSPLLLSLFSTIISTSTPVAAHLLWTLCDGICAYLLVQIWRVRSRTQGSTREKLIVAAYLMNPYLFLPSLALSTSVLENTLYLTTIYFACKRRTTAALLTLAIATHLSLSNILLAPPIILLVLGHAESSLASPKTAPIKWRTFARLFFQFLVFVAILAVTSTVSSDGVGWVWRTWCTELLLPDLTPNPGLWWYFFTEMFDHFRGFFLMVFSMHLLSYVTPVCIKFQHDPLYATFILQGIIAVFKPYPTLSDPGLFLTMISLFPEVYPYFRHPIVTALLHLHSSLLLPLFHNLWLAQGTGNANFFYASTLVFGMANGAAVIDAIWAGLRVAFSEQKGYDVVQE